MRRPMRSMPSPSKASATTSRSSPPSCSVRAGARAKLSTAFIAEEFPARLRARGARPAQWRAPSPASPPRSTTCWASANAVFPDRSNSTVTRERRRAIWLGAEELHADVEREGEAITVLFEDGNSHVLSSELDSRHAGVGGLRSTATPSRCMCA